jgi:hypothetical protein
VIIITVNFPDERREDKKIDHLHRAFERADSGIHWVRSLQDRFGPLQWSLHTADHPLDRCRQCSRVL